MHRAFSLLLVGGFLAGCQTTTTTQPVEPPPPANYQTTSEEVVEILGACVAANGPSKCGPEAMGACAIIKAEAFANPYSSGTTLRNFNNGNAETRARFKLATANTVLRELGFGRNYCG